MLTALYEAGLEELKKKKLSGFEKDNVFVGLNHPGKKPIIKSNASQCPYLICICTWSCHLSRTKKFFNIQGMNS